MGPPPYVWFVIDRKVFMRRMNGYLPKLFMLVNL